MVVTAMTAVGGEGKALVGGGEDLAPFLFPCRRQPLLALVRTLAIFWAGV